jgi:hypothetical protein
MDARFAGVAERTLDWIRLEQTQNDRLINVRAIAPIDRRSNTVDASLWPERRPSWRQQVVWLPNALARTYGPVSAQVSASLGVRPPPGRTPLFLHAQPPPTHAALARRFGAAAIGDSWATPTASYRSVLVWTGGRRAHPVVLKLSLDATVGRAYRALREGQVARAVVVSSLFDAIPASHSRELGLEWFREPAGAAETRSCTGWLLRHLPRMLSKPGGGQLVPAFSLISLERGGRPPLVRMIRDSRRQPEAFVIRDILRPYVRAIAYLLFEQGLQYEGHMQNVLLEVSRTGRLTGRMVLRDLSDTTVNLAYRIARRLPLPRLSRRSATAFPLSTNAADFLSNFSRERVRRGSDTVERYGLWGFVWPINTVLARWFRGYDRTRVEDAYLELWQRAAIFYMNVRPLVRLRPKGMATDEAVAYYLRHTDWGMLGATAATLPADAEALLIEGRARRRAGRVYDRVESPWGDLYLRKNLPEFFRPSY